MGERPSENPMEWYRRLCGESRKGTPQERMQISLQQCESALEAAVSWLVDNGKVKRMLDYVSVFRDDSMRRFNRPAAGVQLLRCTVRRVGIAAVVGNEVEIALHVADQEVQSAGPPPINGEDGGGGPPGEERVGDRAAPALR